MMTKKLVIAAAICAAGVAWARAPNVVDERSLAVPDDSRRAGEFGGGAELGGPMQEQEAVTPSDPVETGINEQGRTADTSGRVDVTTSEQKPELTLRNSYEVKGKVMSVEPGENKLVVDRRDENLPPMELTVVQDSKIQRDGEKANLSELQPGDEVRANFNVAMDEPIAIQVDSKKQK